MLEQDRKAGGCLLCIDTLLCTQGFLIIKGLLDLYSVRLCTLSKAVLSSRTSPKNLSSSSTRNPVNARALATFIVWLWASGCFGPADTANADVWGEPSGASTMAVTLNCNETAIHYKVG